MMYCGPQTFRITYFMKSLLIALFLSCLLGTASAENARTGPSRQDLKLAEKSFQHAIQLQKEGRIEDAFKEASTAAMLVPSNLEYLTTRELLRSRIAGNYIDRGNLLADVGETTQAEEQFKQALALDPQNGYAQQRLHDIEPEDIEHQHVLQLLASVEDVNVTPNPGKQNFHVRGDTRDLYEAISRAFGVGVDYDSTLPSRRVTFDVDGLDFYTAMRLAGKVTKTFWAPVSSKRIIVATDTQEMRRQYERMALQTFRISNALTPADLTDVMNVLRTVFEVKLGTTVAAQNIITVRAPKSQMATISAMLDDLVQARPEVLLEIKAYELDYDKLRQYGLGLPTSFTIFNVFAAIYSALGPNAPAIIKQLRTTGVIDPTKIPIGSLAGLQSSPLLQPFIFFGKGWGLTAVTVSPITAHLSENRAETKTLEHVTLRSTTGVPATLTIGTRFPIQTSTFTNVGLSNQGLPVIGSAVPQVQYEDLGLTFKATPFIQTENNVNLQLQLTIKGLGAQVINGNPVITNRDYSGSITVKDGEPSVVAGVVEEQFNHSTSGYPAVGQVPFLKGFLNTNSNEHSRTEILVVITPHVIRKPVRHQEMDLWNFQ
jgi:general secretion pathway protein D